MAIATRPDSLDDKVSDQDLFAEKLAFGEKVIDAPPSEADQDIIVKDWDDKEEATVRRKLDFILLPIVALAFFSLQMERGNISAVMTSTITKDLKVNMNQINVGTQLLSAGIVLSEIPSNIILQRLGPRVWLSGQLFAWGLVATFQAFIKSYPAFLVTRLLLGSCEVEGLMTLVIAIVFTLLIPPKAGDGRALITMGRWSYFSERESHIIRSRVLLDDPLKARGHIQISRSDIWKTLKNPRILQHVLITLVAMSGMQGLGLYTPTMIKSLGFSASRANVLASVPVYGGMVWVLILAYAGDYTGHRGPFVLISITWNVISYACLRVTPYTAPKWHRYAVLTVTNISSASMHILNIGWLATHCRTPQERSVALALVVMGANCAGISGSQIFRASDAPKYLHGLTAITALAGVSWALALALCLQYYIKDMKAAAEKKDDPKTIS
ncbi:hypothetical protein H0H92_000668 [Tricholoma furcatifolium]|nr:hypothetical protein H0H92_000668 [Tricholoma furcatifolium]